MTVNRTHILDRLRQFGIQKTFRPGQTLHHQGDQIQDIYVILEGIALADYCECNGKEVRMDSFKSGDLIGLEFIQNSGISPCQILAKTQLVTLQFKQKTFMELTFRYPEINLFVFNQFTERLQQFQDRRRESHIMSKRGRVASEIRRMAAPINTQDDTYIVSPKPVISDMAMRLGIARETVSRTVSQLVKTQVIFRDQNAYLVPNLSRLEAEMK